MTNCVWCGRVVQEDISQPAKIPFISTMSMAICCRCVIGLNTIVRDMIWRGKIDEMGNDIEPDKNPEASLDSKPVEGPR